MDLKKIWQLAKPIVIVLVALLGILQDLVFDKDISAILFMIIIGLSFLFRGKSIVEGAKEVWKHIGPRPPRPSGSKHVGPRPPRPSDG